MPNLMTEDNLATNTSTVEMYEFLLNDVPQNLVLSDQTSIQLSVDKHYEAQDLIKEEIVNQESAIKFRISVLKRKFHLLVLIQEQKKSAIKSFSQRKDVPEVHLQT